MDYKRLLEMNEAMMAKWLWKYGMEDHLWRKIIIEKLWGRGRIVETEEGKRELSNIAPERDNKKMGEI